MKRKYIIICAVVFVLVIPAYFLFLQQENPASPSQSALSGSPTSVPQGAKAGQVSNVTKPPEDVQATPEQVTKALYLQFLSAPNFLSEGKYKKNSYLADTFKEDIGNLYDNGNKPIFCPQNKKEAVLVGKRNDVYNRDYGYLAQLFITENVPNGKDLYRVLVQNVNGKWFVFDVNCVRI